MRKILLHILPILLLVTNIQAQNNSIAKNDALALVNKSAKVIGLTSEQLQNYKVSSAYKIAGTDFQMVYLQQTYKGIPVYNQMKVLQFKGEAITSNTGKYFSDIEKLTTSVSFTPSISDVEAIKKAFEEEKLNIPVINSSNKMDEDGIKDYSILKGVTENVKTQLIWLPSQKPSLNQINLIWQVLVAPIGSDNMWQIQIDANTGKVINKVNLTVFETFKPAQNQTIDKKQILQNILKENKASTVLSASYLVIPYPYEAPSFGSAALRTDPWTAAPGNASTLGWNSDGFTDYNISNGNNVYATEDTLGTNTNSGQYITSTTTNPLTFNFPPNYNVEPSRDRPMQQFCTTNLFYWNNIMHDMMYQYGFDEVSGNFQTNNLSRGGNGNDNVMALAQSGAAGHIGNNANFSTPADGGRGRMRMYLFNAIASTTLHVNSPASIVGDYTAVESAFSTANKLANVGPVTGQVVFVNDDIAGTTHQACGTIANSISGKIALISRGSCNFTIKCLAAQNAGAIAVIMINNIPGAAPFIMGGADNTITIPAVMISDNDSATIVNQLLNNVNVTLSGTSGQVLDGDLDNGVICHEYGHGISNRLTGGPANTSCLNNAEEGGEGWSDYFALMMTTNWATATVSNGTIPRGVGTYLQGQSNSGSGFRNYPYCTNLAVNPLTYANMGTGTIGTEVHNIGEIWCMAAWEMTWAVIQQENAINTNLYNFSLANNGGNSIALKLVIEGLRLQPCSPGYVDARNAILTADYNLYAGRHQCAIWTAFAKRGLGYSANQGSSGSATDQTAASDLPPAAVITTQPVDATGLAVGANTSYTVANTAAVNGAYIIYQWQVSTDNGVSYTNISNGGVYSGVTTSTLNITGVTSTMNGYKYRCVLTQGCAVTNSVGALLTLLISSTSITTQPANSIICAGANTSFNIVATGTNVTYQWQANNVNITNGGVYSGATTNTLTITGATIGLSGTVYKCIITATSLPTTLTSSTATITVNAATSIATQPTGSIICAGSSTTFSVVASGSSLTYQWQENQTGTWANITNGGVYSGATTASLTLTNITALMNGYQYRCVVSSACAPLNTNIVLLTVNTAPSLTSQPSAVSICAGNNATYTIAATGTALTYQWQENQTGTWANITNGGVYSGATSNSLTITGATVSMNGYQYKCIVTGSCTPVVTSNAVSLTVGTALSITSQPSATVNCAGTNATYSISTSGTVLSYQWQENQTGTWANITNGGIYSGATTTTLTLTGVTNAMNGYQYRCVATGSCPSINSNAALLTVNALPAITNQPSATTICATQNTSFSITASGTGITYQWQVSTTGCSGTWVNVTNVAPYSGATAATLSITSATVTLNGYAYRCVVSGTCTPVANSSCVLLTVNTPIAISTHPNAVTQCAGNNASFTVVASGTAPTYQWQESQTGTWANITNGGIYGGATTATLTLTGITTAMNNYQYRCIVNGATACSALTSNAAALTVNALPAITSAPVANVKCIGNTATFNTTATGTSLTYQWQENQTGTWANITNGGIYSGATTNALTLTNVTLAMNGYQYRCIISGTCSPSATTTSALLTVNTPVSITTAPSNSIICATGTTSFSVVSAGGGGSTTYQWQESQTGTWVNLSNSTTYSGVSTTTLTITGTTVAMNGYQYRCVVSAACSSINSTAAILTISAQPTITLTASPYTALLPGRTTRITATVSPATGFTTTWTRNGHPTSATGNYIDVTVDSLGVYTATSTIGSCTSLPATITISDSLSNKLFIFPSPNNGHFQVAYYNQGGVSTSQILTVFNSYGQRVYNKVYPVAQVYKLLDVDLRRMGAGVYYVMLSDALGKRIKVGNVTIR